MSGGSKQQRLKLQKVLSTYYVPGTLPYTSTSHFHPEEGDYHFHFLNEATEAERGEGIQGQQCKQSSSDLFVFEAHIVLSASMGPLITGYAIEFQ
jgi:hypothetical protein